jgi:hypothetical protein
MSYAFPFLYECRQCGAIESVKQSDAPPRPDEPYDRPRVRADAALRENYEWGRARPDPICPDCAPSG